MPRIPSLVETGVLSADTQVTTVETMVFSVEIAWDNSAVGESVYLKDTASGTDVKEVAFFKPTASGFAQLRWDQAKRFATGLYLDIGASTGQTLVSIQYKT